MKSLALKTIFGFANLALLSALALFGPAWTLRYWQAWVYLLLCGALTLWIIIVLWRRDPELLARRVKGGPINETRRSQQMIQSFASIASLALLVVPSLDHRFALSRVPTSVVIAGNLLVALGFLIVHRVFSENTFTARSIEVAAGQTVISTGLYAVVRHPMYAGASLILLGTPWPSAPGGDC